MRKLSAIATIVILLVVVASSALSTPIYLRAKTINPSSKLFSGFQPNIIVNPQLSTAHYIIQFQGPLTKTQRAAIDNLGIQLGDYLPDYAFVAKMSPGRCQDAFALDFVTWVEPLAAEYRVDPELRRTWRENVDVFIQMFSEESSAVLRKSINAWGGQVISEENPSGRYMVATIPTVALDALSRYEGVMWIEKWVQPQYANNVAGGIIDVPDVRQQVGLYGSGQIVAFGESGLDTGSLSSLSPDFSGRLIKAYALARQNDWSDLTGHGTHVMGTAGGSGVLSGSDPGNHTYTNSFAGIAPEAGLIIQSIGDESAFVHPPLDLSTMFAPTYNDGARVHCNSWGLASEGQYAVYSQQVDDFVWSHPDFVIVFAAGNDAADGNADGITDSGSMYSPGTSKNCITVGATESVRSTGRITTYGTAWPSDFPANPIKNDYISNNSGGMVAWSGRGPCADGRIKPDLCAPGTNIVSCRTHGALGIMGWAIYDTNYIYWGGTSMSTPMVAGAAALAREYYNTVWATDPSAALVKATLLNSAIELYPGQYGSGSTKDVPSLAPNSAEGWGRLNIADALAPDAPKVTAFVDETAGLTTSEIVEYPYNVLSSAVPFDVTLVWTDPPGSPLSGKQLVNNLDLTVIAPGGQATYYGNGQIDDTNNVEGVRIPTPTVGTYTVCITATNVPTGPQPFALVASGALPGGYITGTVQLGSGRAVQGVTITVEGEGTTRTTITGTNGRYTVHLPAGDYTVTPSKDGPWTFDPVERFVTVGDYGTTDVDFTASAPSGSTTGTITEVLGGQVDYILETPHPYANNADIIYTITARSTATSIRVHFDELLVEDDADYVWVEDASGQMVGPMYTGEYENLWSSWVQGNVLRIHLVSDGSYDPFTTYGFHVDGYETNQEIIGALQGVTLTASPNGGSDISDVDGAYEIENLEPGLYSITPALAHWQFKPDSRSVDVPAGGVASGVDFQASPPGAISGVVTAGDVGVTSHVEESEHSYPPSSLISYYIYGTEGVSRMRVHFTQVEMEMGFDFLFVEDADGNIYDTLSGEYSDIWSSWIPGDTVKIVLESDESICGYGFYSNKYESVTGEHGIPGVTITIQPGGQSIITGADGAYTIPSVTAGRYTVIPTSDVWFIDPISTLANVVPGLTTTDIDFYSTPVQSIASIKALPDGQVVTLIGKVVTAGTDQLDGCFYIEDPSRSSGIKVVTSDTVQEGDMVDITGTLGKVDGERQITASSVIPSEQPGIPICPLGMPCRSLGGSALNEYTPGVTNGIGANSIGLLVKVCGQVITSGSDYFMIMDGSYFRYSPILVKVICPTGVAPPSSGFYSIVGISSCEPAGQESVRRVLARKDSDIVLLQ